MAQDQALGQFSCAKKGSVIHNCSRTCHKIPNKLPQHGHEFGHDERQPKNTRILHNKSDRSAEQFSLTQRQILRLAMDQIHSN